ncbi:class I SAM-dependent methyltransferase [Vibrio sp. ED002]|uniref:class I SAM-dependent methyltransferase n=1 Tax=Vibrio sp. ED002 TaxID=2785123 RepID=UPI00200EE61B|nr:class I SAM-dependent methyltransferase [Vibrio sp. ED002]UQA51968.1 class I SAM-dependent methyltransferase [Vibrio sp. ED002]
MKVCNAKPILNNENKIEHSSQVKLNYTEIVVPPCDKKTNANSLFGLPIAEITAVTSTFTVVISLFVAFFTIRKYSKDHKHQSLLLEREKNKEEILKAKEKIEKFYGPINSLLEESRIIYKYFAVQEKLQYEKNGDYFRALNFFTEPEQKNDKSRILNKIKISPPKSGADKLSLHDRELFSHIIDISDKITDLIENQSGHVDNPALHILLGKLTAHYRIVKSAFEGKISEQNTHLDDVVFPLEINGAINSEINKLLLIINKKNTQENINVANNKNVKYYDDNCISYNNITKKVDMSAIYKKVRKHVANGSNILDAGCGAGRDTEYFIKHGFKVSSFDASINMVNICNEYPFAFCEQKVFSSINYPQLFDLVWASASLLHLDKEEFKHAIQKLFKALKPSGYLYFSLKLKKDTIGSSKNGSRTFYYHETDEVIKLLEQEFKMDKIEIWNTESSLKNDDTFINFLYKK